MSRDLRVLQVNNQVRLGGAETVIRQLLRGFPRSRLVVADGKTYPPGVIPLYPPLLSRLHHSRFHHIAERVAPRAQWTDRAFRRLAESDADLIHLHNFHGNYATAESLAWLARRKPVVWTFHALWGVTGGCDHPRDCRKHLSQCSECPQIGRWPLGQIDNTSVDFTGKLSTIAPLPLHVIAPSRWIAAEIENSRIGRGWSVHQIPNACDAEVAGAFQRRNQDRQASILVVTRDFMDEQKGRSLVIEALCAIPERLRVPLHLVGRNADRFAAELPGWSVEVLGYIDDPAKLAEVYERSTVFLFASPAENFPCVILEAMAAGLCIVATPTGGVVEQVEHHVSGLLAEAIDGQSLATQLCLALSDQEGSAAMGRAAQARVEEAFDERTFIRRHAEVYDAVLSQWRSAA